MADAWGGMCMEGGWIPPAPGPPWTLLGLLRPCCVSPRWPCLGSCFLWTSVEAVFSSASSGGIPNRQHVLAQHSTCFTGRSCRQRPSLWQWKTPLELQWELGEGVTENEREVQSVSLALEQLGVVTGSRKRIMFLDWSPGVRNTLLIRESCFFFWVTTFLGVVAQDVFRYSFSVHHGYLYIYIKMHISILTRIKEDLKNEHYCQRNIILHLLYIKNE